MRIPWFRTPLEREQRAQEKEELKEWQTNNWHKAFAYYPVRVGNRSAAFLDYVARKRVSWDEYGNKTYGGVMPGSFVYKTLEDAVIEKMRKK